MYQVIKHPANSSTRTEKQVRVRKQHGGMVVIAYELSLPLACLHRVAVVDTLLPPLPSQQFPRTHSYQTHPLHAGKWEL